jgi:APA family basic amino acid/polyamine antiporter
VPLATGPATPAARDTDAGLLRAIGPRTATLFVVGSVIGSGIFLTTGTMAVSIPSASLLLLAWTLGGVLALAGGLTYSEMGVMFPRSGGLYVYLREAFGPLFGFLSGWVASLVVLSGGIAAVAVGFAEYLSYFVPALSTSRPVAAVPLGSATWTISAGQIVAALAIVVLGAVNYVGVKSGNMVNAVLTVAKVAGLAALPVMALLVRRVDPVLTPIVPPDLARPLPSFGVAMIAVLWTYEGWYFLSYAAGEVRDPRRNLPRAFVFGTLALTTIYVVVNLAYVFALSLDEMRGVVRIAERAATVLMGPGGATFIAATVVVSTFGCNAAAILAASRLLFAMAQDGLFFRALGAVHPAYRTPHVAIVYLTIWSAVLALSGSYDQLFTYVMFASLLFGAAGGVALFRLRRLRPEIPRPYKAWGYPIVPGIFVLGSSAFVVNTLLERPRESLAGLGLLALGLPAYWYWRRTGRS